MEYYSFLSKIYDLGFSDKPVSKSLSEEERILAKVKSGYAKLNLGEKAAGCFTTVFECTHCTGDNGWEDEEYSEVTTEYPYPWRSLEAILHECGLKDGWRAYPGVVSLVKWDMVTTHGYYGESNVYSYYYLPVGDLYDYLSNNGYFK